MMQSRRLKPLLPRKRASTEAKPLDGQEPTAQGTTDAGTPNEVAPYLLQRGIRGHATNPLQILDFLMKMSKHELQKVLVAPAACLGATTALDFVEHEEVQEFFRSGKEGRLVLPVKGEWVRMIKEARAGKDGTSGRGANAKNTNWAGLVKDERGIIQSQKKPEPKWDIFGFHVNRDLFKPAFGHAVIRLAFPPDEDATCCLLVLEVSRRVEKASKKQEKPKHKSPDSTEDDPNFLPLPALKRLINNSKESDFDRCEGLLDKLEGSISEAPLPTPAIELLEELCEELCELLRNRRWLHLRVNSDKLSVLARVIKQLVDTPPRTPKTGDALNLSLQLVGRLSFYQRRTNIGDHPAPKTLPKLGDSLAHVLKVQLAELSVPERDIDGAALPLVSTALVAVKYQAMACSVRSYSDPEACLGEHACLVKATKQLVDCVYDILDWLLNVDRQSLYSAGQCAWHKACRDAFAFLGLVLFNPSRTPSTKLTEWNGDSVLFDWRNRHFSSLAALVVRPCDFMDRLDRLVRIALGMEGIATATAPAAAMRRVVFGATQHGLYILRAMRNFARVSRSSDDSPPPQDVITLAQRTFEAFEKMQAKDGALAAYKTRLEETHDLLGKTDQPADWKGRQEDEPHWLGPTFAQLLDAARAECDRHERERERERDIRGLLSLGTVRPTFPSSSTRASAVE